MKTLRGAQHLRLLWRVGALGACEPGFAAGFGERSHAADVGGALGHADHAARIEQIEIKQAVESVENARKNRVDGK